jgi:hypothetical protein
VTWISHALDCQLFGLEPTGHHLMSVALHALNAVLLFLALRALTGALWRSAVVAALFAVHPLHVESVAWVAERKDVLCATFAFLILCLYAHRAARPAKTHAVAIPVLFALGLMAKPMLVTLPFVLLLLDYWPLRRWDGPRLPVTLIREKLPLIVLSWASCVVTFLVQQRGGAVMALDAMPPATRVGNAAVAYVTYLTMTFRPTGLAMFYPMAAAIPAWKVLGAVAMLVAVTAAVFALRRRAPYLAVGWLWYAGMLVPVIGFVQVGLQAYADRYTYLPLVGIFIMIVWGAAELLGESARSRAILVTAAALAVAVCALLTWRQVALWRDSETIFTHTLAVTPPNYVIEGNLGGVLLQANRNDEAVAHLEASLRIRPGQASVLSNLGAAALLGGRLDEAEAYLRQALAINPTSPSARNNLRVVLQRKGAVK